MSPFYRLVWKHKKTREHTRPKKDQASDIYHICHSMGNFSGQTNQSEKQCKEIVNKDIKLSPDFWLLSLSYGIRTIHRELHWYAFVCIAGLSRISLMLSHTELVIIQDLIWFAESVMGPMMIEPKGKICKVSSRRILQRYTMEKSI